MQGMTLVGPCYGESEPIDDVNTLVQAGVEATQMGWQGRPLWVASEQRGPTHGNAKSCKKEEGWHSRQM